MYSVLYPESNLDRFSGMVPEWFRNQILVNFLEWFRNGSGIKFLVGFPEWFRNGSGNVP